MKISASIASVAIGIVLVGVCGITADTPPTQRVHVAANDSTTLLPEAQASPLRPRIALVGDSLTRGYDAAANDWPDTDTIRSSLAADAAARKVRNLGISGQTVDEIAIGLGALPLIAQESVAVPTTGSVAIAVQSGIGWRPDRTWSFRGALAGVPGTLTRTGTATTQLSFQPDPGLSEPVQVIAGSRFVGDAGDPWDLMILGAGRNDISYGVSGTERSVVEHVKAGLKRIIDWQTARSPRFLVWGTINTVNEVAGTSGHAMVVEINDWCQSEYPLNFVDVRRSLIDDAIHELGIRPTKADLDRMSGDAPPPQIMADSVHWGKPVVPFVADLLSERLQLLG